jgi:Transcriptional regulatory protein, C terminal/AAA ATPase domain
VTTVAARNRAGSCVGRETELQALAALVRSADQRVGYLYGVAGIGKSVLLRRFLQQATDAGASVLELDCRTVEPTERGFLQATGGFLVVDELVNHLASLPPPTVLALDHCEVFWLMDTWLRHVLVPALPPGAVLILSGRPRPVAGWFSVDGFQTFPLGPLHEPDALGLLDQLGVGPADAVRLNRIARGHPLALTLSAAGVAEHPQLGLEDAAMTRVVDELARRYLDDVDDDVIRRVLEASSVVRRTTVPVLSAMLPDVDGDDALRRLLDQPFVEAGRDGLVVHEAVQTAIADFLRGANPLRYHGYRTAAWRELRSETRAAAPADLWRYTADMLYLIDNPVVREAFFPTGAQPLAVEPPRTGDAAAVRSIAHRHEGPEAAAALMRWWDVAPRTFSVVRDRDGDVSGFLCLLDDRTLRRPPVPGDPVVERWSRHLRDSPLPGGQVALALRRWLDADSGELPCATQAACWLDVKRTYMALRPALRRMYVVVQDVPTYWPVVEELGFRPLPHGEVELDGVVFTTVMLDFGKGSVDEWLSRLVGAQLGIAEGQELDEEARELTVHGARLPLTPLEFGLFRHLRDREGKSVTRQELLREVWSTDFVGGSNVVDAVVRSLRRKLGREAIVVETVRSSGYRLRSDWRAYLS